MTAVRALTLKTDDGLALEAELAESEPAYIACAARGMINLSQIFSDLGEIESATTWAQSCVNGWKELLRETSDDAYKSELENSLRALAVVFMKSARWSEALTVLQEALNIREGLKSASIDDSLKATQIVQNMILCQFHLGRHAEAANASAQIILAYKTAAVQNRDEHLPDLAVALGNHSNYLGDCGRDQEALEAADEAVKLHIELVTRHRDAFLKKLADGHFNRGRTQIRLHKLEAALDDTRAARVYYEELQAASSRRFPTAIAKCLHNEGTIQAQLDNPEKAVEALQAAVDEYRQAMPSDPDIVGPEISKCVDALRDARRKMNSDSDVIALRLEIVAAYRELYAEKPGYWDIGLASSLSDLAGDLAGLGRHEEALPVRQECVSIYQKLDVKTPDRYQGELTGHLLVLTKNYLAIGKGREAADAARSCLENLSKWLPGMNKEEMVQALIEEHKSQFGSLGGDADSVLSEFRVLSSKFLSEAVAGPRRSTDGYSQS